MTETWGTPASQSRASGSRLHSPQLSERGVDQVTLTCPPNSEAQALGVPRSRNVVRKRGNRVRSGRRRLQTDK